MSKNLTVPGYRRWTSKAQLYAVVALDESVHDLTMQDHSCHWLVRLTVPAFKSERVPSPKGKSPGKALQWVCRGLTKQGLLRSYETENITRRMQNICRSSATSKHKYNKRK